MDNVWKRQSVNEESLFQIIAHQLWWRLGIGQSLFLSFLLVSVIMASMLVVCEWNIIFFFALFQLNLTTLQSLIIMSTSQKHIKKAGFYELWSISGILSFPLFLHPPSLFVLFLPAYKPSDDIYNNILMDFWLWRAHKMVNILYLRMVRDLLLFPRFESAISFIYFALALFYYQIISNCEQQKVGSRI